jgi:hypothetical protein
MRMFRGWFHSQNGDMLGEYTAKLQRSVVRFLWAKGFNAKDIHKEVLVFPVYGGKYLSRKAVHNWVEKFSEGRLKVADDARSSAEVGATTVKTSMLRVSTHW